MITHLGEFFAISTVVIVTPGPDTVLTVKNSVCGGRGCGLHTGAGVCTGQTIWALTASAGVAALVAASQPAFAVIKLAGATFLICLGLRSLYSAARPASPGEKAPGRRLGRLNAQAAFGQGLLSNITNPKMAVFFISLLPQFTSMSKSPLLAMLALALMFSAMTLTWLACCAAVAGKAGGWLRTQRASRMLDTVSGTMLVGLGVRLATEHL